MKKYLLLSLTLTLLFLSHTSAQVYNGNVECYNQEAIDAMINYTSITGSVRIDAQYVTKGEISGHDIKNMDGFANITSIGKGIVFFFTDSLENVDGLSNLTSIGTFLAFRFNDGLKNLNGLSHITSVTLLWLNANPSLTDISGLSGITSVDSLWIDHNYGLKNLDAFSNLTGTVHNVFLADNHLLNIDGLNGITSIPDSINIIEEDYLPNLDGLSGLTSLGDIHIYQNINLNSFCGLYPVLNSNGFTGIYDLHNNEYNPTVQEIIACGPCSGIHAPTAKAGTDFTAIQGETVQLDGTGSTDPDNDQLTFKWSFVYKPFFSHAVLSSDTSRTPTFNADSTGYYGVKLIVNDGCIDGIPDTVVINVISVPAAFLNPIPTIQSLPLSKGNKNALISKLQNALAKYNAGDLKAAKNILLAYINQLLQFVASGYITQAQAQPLIDFANQLIDVINSMLPKIAENNVTQLPMEYSVSQNYPNPFNPTTSIRYALPKGGYVSLRVYDILGREVANLVDGNREAGYYEINFDGSKLSSGMYIYRLQTGNYISTKKMLMIK